MIVLGIETSGRTGSVALLRDGALVAERTTETGGRRPAQALLVELAALFEEAKLAPGDCQAVALSIGPGSFTGLRIGVVCATKLHKTS